jgi:hypothetical protein
MLAMNGRFRHLSLQSIMTHASACHVDAVFPSAGRTGGLSASCLAASAEAGLSSTKPEPEPVSEMNHAGT